MEMPKLRNSPPAPLFEGKRGEFFSKLMPEIPSFDHANYTQPDKAGGNEFDDGDAEIKNLTPDLSL